MTSYPYIAGPDAHGMYIICRGPDYSLKISEYELKTIYTILDTFFKDSAVKLNQFNYNGLVTIDRNGAEVIQGWYSGFDYVNMLAKKLVNSKMTAGARAYICIGEYGKFTAPDISPADEDSAEDGDTAPACTLDAWGLGL